jgi:hypothetical protein
MTSADIERGYYMIEKDCGIIECAFTRGSSTLDDSTAVAQDFSNQLQHYLKPFNQQEALILLELTTQDGEVSDEARKIYAELAKDKRIMRLAIFGGLLKYRLVAKVLLPIMFKHTMKVFDTKEAALVWLMHS